MIKKENINFFVLTVIGLKHVRHGNLNEIKKLNPSKIFSGMWQRWNPLHRFHTYSFQD